jgi:hypothetical protein
LTQHEFTINRLNHFVAPVNDLDIHFIHKRGSGASPMPLNISHSWPGTVVEFLNFVEPLAHPEHFGGQAEDTFDGVASSLLGFGFSGKLLRALGPHKIADYFNTLMTEA